MLVLFIYLELGSSKTLDIILNPLVVKLFPERSIDFRFKCKDGKIFFKPMSEILLLVRINF